MGNIIGTGEFIGGLIGYNDNPDARYCYWDTETSGQVTSAGGEGRATDEMTYDFSKIAYEHWDFNDIWAAIENAVEKGRVTLTGVFMGRCVDISAT